MSKVMSITGHLVTDHLARVANNSMADKLKVADNIDCVGSFYSTQAIIRYGNKSNMHRPYLYLTGHVASITGDFPCGIDRIVLGDNNTMENPGPAVSYQLEFTQEELAQLCQKGLFTPNFRCPDIFINNEFMLPLKCHCEYLEPDNKNDVPLLFIGIKDQHNVAMRSVDTGYSLVEYFENVLQEQPFESTLDYDVDSVDTFTPEDENYNHTDDDFLFSDKTAQVEDTVDATVFVNAPVDVLSDDDKILQQHFENIRKEVDDKLSYKSTQKESEKPAVDTKDVSDVDDFTDPVSVNPISTKPVSVVAEPKKREVSDKLSEIAKADDELYDDFYDGDDEFI